VAGLAALSALPFAMGVLLPYYVNGLHRLPLSEVASGRYDPKDLWPSGLGGGLLQLSGLLSLALTPVGLGFCVLLSALGAVWAAWARSVTTVGFLVLALACGAAVVWFMGPTAGALATWRLD
jgi:hypothetical protein